jgi:predicted NBD/HSP70 family sugar kinase
MPSAKTTSLVIKKNNRNQIFNLIRNSDGLSRQDLVYSSKLCLPTITQNLVELQEEGLIYESGSFGHTGGRRAKAYTLIKNARIALGFDITRHHICIVAVDLHGNIIGKNRIRYNFSLTDKYFRQLGSMVEELVEKLGVAPKAVLGIGIGVPGLITEDQKKVFYGKILDFTDTTLDQFSRYIPYRCALYNDANAAGFAETWSEPELANSFYVMLGNNVGGSILIDHQVYAGESPRSGEIGHMTIVPNGLPCYCGQKGCVETYCAATVLSDHTNGILEDFFTQLKAGNHEFQKIWKEYLTYLAVAVNNIRMLFDCPVIIGGYVGAYMDDYIGELREIAAKRNTFQNNANYLKVCKYKTESIAAGAALPYIEDFCKNI